MSELLLKSDLSLLNDRICNLNAGLATMPENGTMQVSKAFLTAILGYMEELLGMCRGQTTNADHVQSRSRHSYKDEHGQWTVDDWKRGITEHGIAVDRLAAFEDTGMEPEEIKTMREWWSQVPMTIKDQVKRICGGEFTRADRIKQMHPDWSDTFIEEMMSCPYTKKPCSDVEKHNLNLCDSCPETFM